MRELAAEMTPMPLTTPALGNYWKQIHRWLARRLRNPDVADDVTQEVFLRLCAMRRTEYVRDPLAYLFGIAAHVISAHYVAEVRSRSVISYDTEAAQRAADCMGNVFDDDSEERLDLQHRLGQALEQLPPKYKTVLLLCKVQGMTYGEAATASGLSIHTVEKYLIRARAQVTALMCDP